MNNKPLLSALGAAIYILGITALINFLSIMDSEASWIVPVTMLSLLVLSVATMAYLFLREPIRIYLEEKNLSSAINTFVQTLFYFAGFALLSVVIYLVSA